jgi:hypothetical protein
MLGDKTLHVAVPFELVRNGEVFDMLLGSKNGEYRSPDQQPSIVWRQESKAHNSNEYWEG